MNKDLKEILLRRKHMVCVKSDSDYVQTGNEKALSVAMLKNVQALGFTFSKELWDAVSHMGRAELENMYLELLPRLKALVGADVQYTPMYPNFPRQVMEASEAELFINAFIHYFTYGEIVPDYEKNERLPLISDNKMTVLTVGNHDDLMAIFANLVGSKTSLSAQDKVDVEVIFTTCGDYGRYLPNEIPLKENVGFIGKLIFEKAPIKSSKEIEKYFYTATDVLRLIVALSDGDISLAQHTHYRKLKRPERRMIMDLLAHCGSITEDLFRYHNEWLILGNIIHPFEFKAKKYARVNEAFNTLRNEKKPMMFGGAVFNLIQSGNVESAANLLRNRPGDFARQLDKLLRDSKNPNEILDYFAEVAKEVSAPVLLQVREHFLSRFGKDRPEMRIFFPKGNLANSMMIRNELPILDETICNSVAMICSEALIRKYSEKDSLGKVYLSKDFKNYVVPFSQRSASKATKTIVRGSRIPLGDKAKVVRGFIWWTNTDKSNSDYYGNGRVDIDLSAVAYDKNWRYLRHCSYTNLRSNDFRLYHSGDITNGGPVNGKGVAEFLDVDIDSVVKNGGKYIVFQVYNFTRQTFSELPNCRFGWMEREDVHSGEIFEPSTVEMKMDLTANSTVAIPVIFDCENRQFIWCDMSINKQLENNTRFMPNNLESNLNGVIKTCYAIEHMVKPNMLDLVLLNAIARGEIVDDRNDADIIFDNDTTPPYEVVNEVDELTGISKPVLREKKDVPIVTVFDMDYIMGQLI